MTFMNSLVPTWTWNGLPHLCMAISRMISDRKMTLGLFDVNFFLRSLAASFDLNLEMVLDFKFYLHICPRIYLVYDSSVAVRIRCPQLRRSSLLNELMQSLILNVHRKMVNKL